MNEIFLDTETTGLSVNDNHRIVEIACVETNNLVPTNKIFHKIINPNRDVPDEAFKVHGFSSEFLKDKETFKTVADEFLDFIKEKKIIIHNAPFDLSFLNNELKLLKKDELKKLKNYKVVICSNSEYSQIADEAKSFNFNKVMSYEKFLK